MIGKLVFGISGLLLYATKCALWFWVVLGLRFTQEGSVAAGEMVAACEAQYPDLAAFAVVDGGPSCNGPFQVKAGKLILAWVILSVICC